MKVACIGSRETVALGCDADTSTASFQAVSSSPAYRFASTGKRVRASMDLPVAFDMATRRVRRFGFPWMKKGGRIMSRAHFWRSGDKGSRRGHHAQGDEWTETGCGG